MDVDNTSREDETHGQPLVGRVHYRPDRPDAGNRPSGSNWSLQAIGLGVVLLIVMVVMVVIIVQWALVQPSG